MNQSSIPNLAPLIGGLAGGSASTILLYPLDLIKVRMQVNEEPHRWMSLSKKTVLENMRDIIRKEGRLGLYQGLSPALIGSAVSWGGYFYIYEWMKGILSQQRRRNNDEIALKPLENFTAACIAGAALVLITNPIWLIKTRMQLQTRNLKYKEKAYDGILDATRTIIREEGPLALYKGAIPALMLVSHGGVQFVSYEFLKEKFGVYSKRKRNQNMTLLNQLQNSIGYLTMGAVSKIIASTTTYPLQVIKSRLQKRSNLNTNKIKPYLGVLDCTKRIWKNEGLYGFFKGCVPNALRVAPSAAITFVVYEGTVDFIQ